MVVLEFVGSGSRLLQRLMEELDLSGPAGPAGPMPAALPRVRPRTFAGLFGVSAFSLFGCLIRPFEGGPSQLFSGGLRVRRNCRWSSWNLTRFSYRSRSWTSWLSRMRTSIAFLTGGLSSVGGNRSASSVSPCLK